MWPCSFSLRISVAYLYTRNSQETIHVCIGINFHDTSCFMLTFHLLCSSVVWVQYYHVEKDDWLFILRPQCDIKIWHVLSEIFPITVLHIGILTNVTITVKYAIVLKDLFASLAVFISNQHRIEKDYNCIVLEPCLIFIFIYLFIYSMKTDFQSVLIWMKTIGR